MCQKNKQKLGAVIVFSLLLLESFIVHSNLNSEQYGTEEGSHKGEDNVAPYCTCEPVAVHIHRLHESNLVGGLSNSQSRIQTGTCSSGELISYPKGDRYTNTLNDLIHCSQRRFIYHQQICPHK